LIPDAKLPPRPEPPAPGDCCRSDCSPCVYEIYERALEQWEREVEAILKAREVPPQPE
jgi:hypothetical protein